MNPLPSHRGTTLPGLPKTADTSKASLTPSTGHATLLTPTNRTNHNILHGKNKTANTSASVSAIVVALVSALGVGRVKPTSIGANDSPGVVHICTLDSTPSIAPSSPTILSMVCGTHLKICNLHSGGTTNVTPVTATIRANR